MTPTPASPAETVDHEAANDWAAKIIERPSIIALWGGTQDACDNLARAYLALRAQLADKERIASTMLRQRNEHFDRAEAAEARATASDASRAAMREALAGMVGLIQLVLARDDLGDDLRLAIEGSHRYVTGKAALSGDGQTL